MLAVCDPDAPLQMGDTIQVSGQTLTIAGLLKYDLFSGDGLFSWQGVYYCIR